MLISHRFACVGSFTCTALLTECLTLGSPWRVQEAAAKGRQQMADAVRQYRHLTSYLLRFMRNKTLRIAGEEELEHFIMRLNFNNYYDLEA